MTGYLFRSPGDVISRIRRARDLGDVELAHDAGMKVGQLRDIESGVPPTESQLEAISEALDVDPNALRFITGDVPEHLQDAMVDNPDQALNALEKTLGVEPSEDESVEKPNPVHSSEAGELYKGDCREILGSLEEESFDLIFCDPPFNLDKDYGESSNDNVSEDEYLKWCTEWIDEAISLLKPGGAFFIYNLPKWNVHLSHYLCQRLNMRDWIAIDIKFGLPRPKQLYPSHYSLIYFIKGSSPERFDPPRLPIETCPHCGGEQSDYGGYKSKLNSKGMNLTDVWDDIPPVRHSKYLDRDANQLSIKLLHRVFQISTKPGDRVLDPFMGAGTTAAAAEVMDREWTGIELHDCQPIIDRLNNLDRDKNQIENIEANENVLFTEDALNLRSEYKEEFNFNFKDYDLSDSPSDSIQQSFDKYTD
jgi:site-specific DNA-methyltransferase (adenine-specific)